MLHGLHIDASVMIRLAFEEFDAPKKVERCPITPDRETLQLASLVHELMYLMFRTLRS